MSPILVRDVVTDFNAAQGDVLDLSDVLSHVEMTVIGAEDSAGNLVLQVVNTQDAGKVYQEISVQSVQFSDTNTANTILDSLKDHGTSSNS